MNNKPNDLITTKSNSDYIKDSKNRKNNLLHTAILSIRQDLPICIKNGQIDLKISHIEIDDTGLKPLTEIGNLITRFATRKKPNPNLLTATIQNSHVSERDSVVNLHIDTEINVVSIEASNLFVQLTTSFLANIGPFAEFDVVEIANHRTKSAEAEKTRSASGSRPGNTATPHVNADTKSLTSQNSVDKQDIPEIRIKAKSINFTIEPDELPKHITSLSHTQPFTVNIPNKDIEVAFKIFEGKLDLLKFVQNECGGESSSGQITTHSKSQNGGLSAAHGNSVKSGSQSSYISALREENLLYEKDVLIEKLQTNEVKLISSLENQNSQLEHLIVTNSSLKNQVELLQQQLERCNAERDEYKMNFENILREHLKMVKK